MDLNINCGKYQTLEGENFLSPPWITPVLVVNPPKIICGVYIDVRDTTIYEKTS